MSENNSLGTAVLDLTARVDQLEKDLEKAKTTTEKKADDIKKVFSAIAGSAILAAIAKAYNQVVMAAEEAMVTEAKVAGVIRATGNAAGYTVDQLSEMANEFSRLTGIDDEVILDAEAVLLTFRKIGKEVFPDATQAALDMSAVMGQDLQSSIVQIGKALNDPIEGISALKRVGVTFNDEQIKMIKNMVAANDVIGAQRVVLEELQNEFGGTAMTMEEASAGGNRLRNAWENYQAELGKRVIPQQRALNNALSDGLDSITENIGTQSEYRDALVEVAHELGYESELMYITTGRYSAHREEVEQLAEAKLRTAGMIETITARFGQETTAIENLDTAIENLDFKNMLDLTISLSTETERFNEQQEGVRQKQAEIKTEIDALIQQGWSPLSDKVSDLQLKYDNLGTQYDTNALKHKAATDKILYDLFIQKISVDGVTSAEYEMALQAGLTFGQIDQNAIDTARNFDAVAEAVVNGQLKVEDMQRALDLLPKYKSIDVVIDVIANYPAAYGTGDDDSSYANYASGTDGWLTVPSGYPNDSYLVGLTSGEHFSVVPDISSTDTMPAPAIGGGDISLAGGGGGAMPPIQFIYQPFIGVNDEYEAKNKLRSIVNDLNREASRK